MGIDQDSMMAELRTLDLVDEEDLALAEELIARAREVGENEHDMVSLAQAMSRGVDRIAAAHADVAVQHLADIPADELDEAIHLWMAIALPQATDAFKLLFSRRLERTLHRRMAASVDPIHSQLSVAFVDLRGSTAFMVDRPPDAIEALADALYLTGREVSRRNNVSAGKYLGDGVLFGSSDSDRLIGTAVEAVARLGETTPLRAGAGIARGDVIRRGGDWLGTPVNLAARLAELAGPDELLIDADAASEDLVPDRWIEVRPRGMRRPRRVAVLAVPAVSP